MKVCLAKNDYNDNTIQVPNCLPAVLAVVLASVGFEIRWALEYFSDVDKI